MEGGVGFYTSPPFLQVLPCSIRHVHDWSSCNFTHPGEKARRRDPQTHSYTGIACPDMKKVSPRSVLSEKVGEALEVASLLSRSDA